MNNKINTSDVIAVIFVLVTAIALGFLLKLLFDMCMAGAC